MAVFGILDDETGLYTYRYARVTFDKVGARTMVHLIPDPDDPTLIRGVAAALVPDDPESMSQWTEFLMPQREHEALGKAAVDQACNRETVVVTPGAYVRVGNGRWKYFPPVTERRCSTQCKSLDSASCSPPLRVPFPLPPPPPFPEGDPVGPIETIKPVKPCKGDPLPVMKIRPTAPSKSLESGRYRPCLGSNCAPGTKAVRFEGGVLKGHFGIDLECELGDPIYAPFSGFYYSRGWQVDIRGEGYGRHIQFVSTDDNGENFYWGFSHLEDARYFTERFVTAGQIVGYCGKTGYTSDGIHTHMEMGRGPVFSKGSRSQLVDPETRLTTTFNSAGTPGTPTNCRR